MRGFYARTGRPRGVVLFWICRFRLQLRRVTRQIGCPRVAVVSDYAARPRKGEVIEMKKAIETICAAMIGKARLFGVRATGRTLRTVSWRNRVGIVAGLCILFTATRAHAVPGSYFPSFVDKSGAVTEDQKLTASDGAAWDYFGGSVSISGGYAVVGAYGNNGNSSNSGSAYIFERGAGGTWLQGPKLTASDGAGNDRFGEAVSISGDYAIVGARYDGDDGDYSGSAYIFERGAGGTWGQFKLTASDGAGSDYFGGSVSISGNYAIVGANGDDDNGGSSGSAYIFERDVGGTWLQEPKLIASDGAGSDFFGTSVSISGDYAIVGAYRDDDNGSGSGSAYIFERDAGGTWSQGPKLTASDGADWDEFGKAVSISGDYAIVGARYDGDNGDYSGSAYIFERGAGGTWDQQSKLTAPDGTEYDQFGESVSISGDYALVGAPGSEFAYFFERDAGGVWTASSVKLAMAESGWATFSAVSLSGDNAFMGAEMADGNSDYSGAAYIYENVSGAVALYEYAWTNAAGGSFNDSANWWDGTVVPPTGPDADTYVVFTDDPDPLDAPSGPVVLVQHSEVHGIGLDTPSVVTLDLAGHNLTIADDPDAPSGIVTFQAGSLRLMNTQPTQSVFTLHGIDVSTGALDIEIGQRVTLNVVADGVISAGAPNLSLNGGTLMAGNADPVDTHAHFLLEQGKNMAGRGTVSGNYKNNGDVIGDGTAAGERIVFDSLWTVSGKGTFTNTMIVGTFAPGESPGVTNGTNQGFSGTVQIELGGATPGSGDDNHDQINDTATILLSGSPTLEVLPWNSFVPEVGDQFVILTWGVALDGTFADVVVDSWFTDLGLDFEPHYNDVGGAGNLTIEVTPEPATLLLLALGGLAVIRRKRRRA